jgi:hypothetical protein
MTWSNGNSFNGNSSFFAAAVDDPEIRSLPLLFRYGIPGFPGWLAATMLNGL